ncbi:MAG: YitT family protein [Collinsella sp.]
MANAVDALTDRALELARLTIVRRIITAVAVTVSALIQTIPDPGVRAARRPAAERLHRRCGRFVDRITALGGVRIDTSLGMLALNIPVAAMCWSGISRRFVIFSMTQVALSSLFLNIFNFGPFLGDKIMLIIFGGVVSGLSIAIALKAGASTGGTDFIALWVSNHTGKTIWGAIFAFNCLILVIFGQIFGWDNAAYSIVFQFISTKTIDSFYHRYDRVTLQITTRLADEVMTAYVNHFQHGISCAEVVGGYSRDRMYLLHTVVSTYESQDIIKLVCDVDPGAVINVFHTLDFVGGWWGGHVDEPLPTAVPDPDKPARLLSKQARRQEQSGLQQDDGR